MLLDPNDIAIERSALPANSVAPIALIAAALVAIIGLALPLFVPIGPMYWDTHIYVDAAHRITMGQLPSVDFFTPAGPLGYYLSWALMALSDNAQPMLAASWSIMLVTVPLMLLVTRDGVRHAPAATLATVAAFILFSLLPFNSNSYYPVPGADGFGIYNRQGAQLMLVLTAAIMLMRNRTAMMIVIGLAMTAMFFTKITAFLGAGLICAFGLLVGRIPLRVAIGSIIIAVLIALPLELTTGMVSAYVGDIATLVGMNTEALAPRMLQAASRTAGISVMCGILIVALFAWHSGGSQTQKQRGWYLASLDHPALWTGVVLFAGLFYESQNTGSQLLILLWPVLAVIAVALFNEREKSRLSYAMIALIAAALLPPAVNTVQYALRAGVGMVKQTALVNSNLGKSGHVTVRDVPLDRANDMRQWFIDHPAVIGELADYDKLLSPLLYSDFDFQIAFLQNIDQAVTELNRREAQGLQYDTIMQLDFAQPIPAFLDKTPVKHIAIGADPHRAVPPLDEETKAAVAGADIVLEPACPFTDATDLLLDHYMPALSGHIRVKLTPCYYAWVKPALAAKF